MNYIKQFCIIIIIAFIGEILNWLIPFPIPASIYGIIILFICLQTGLIKLEKVKAVSSFLIDIMPVMFIPAAVGLMTSWDILKPVCIPFVVITVVSTVVVMAVSGKVTQGLMKHKKEAESNE